MKLTDIWNRRLFKSGEKGDVMGATTAEDVTRILKFHEMPEKKIAMMDRLVMMARHDNPVATDVKVQDTLLALAANDKLSDNIRIKAVQTLAVTCCERVIIASLNDMIENQKGLSSNMKNEMQMAVKTMRIKRQENLRQLYGSFIGHGKHDWRQSIEPTDDTNSPPPRGRQ